MILLKIFNREHKKNIQSNQKEFYCLSIRETLSKKEFNYLKENQGKFMSKKWIFIN